MIYIGKKWVFIGAGLFVLVMIILPFGYLTASAQNIRIPETVRRTVGDVDLVEVFCYETKARGGEAVAKIEALSELLPPLLKEVEEFGVVVPLPDFKSMISNLEAGMEAVCNARMLEEAQMNLQNFINAAEGLRSKLAVELRGKIEPPLRERGEKLRVRLEKELRAEGEALGKEIELKLRAEALEEAEPSKQAVRKRIEDEIMARFKAGEFGERPDPAKLQELGMEMGQKEAEKIKAELTAKYEKLAQSERERITKLMEEKAEQLGGEEKRKLEGLRDKFESLGAKINALAESKMTRWQQFKIKAAQKRKEILIKTAGAQLDSAKAAVRDFSRQLDLARQYGKNVPSAEELAAELENDKQALIEKFATGIPDENAIYQAEMELRAKWTKIRRDLESVALKGAQEIIDTTRKRLAESGATQNKISRAIREIEKSITCLESGLKKRELQDVHPTLKWSRDRYVDLNDALHKIAKAWLEFEGYAAQRKVAYIDTDKLLERKDAIQEGAFALQSAARRMRAGPQELPRLGPKETATLGCGLFVMPEIVVK